MPRDDEVTADASGMPGAGTARSVLARLERLEAAAATLGAEVRTRRLVVCDPWGEEVIVADATAGYAQVRVRAPHAVPRGGEEPMGAASAPAPPAGDADGRAVGAAPVVEVVVFAAPGQHGLGPLAGLQIWARGSVVAAFEVGDDGLSGWQAAVVPPGSSGGPPFG